MSAVRVHMTSWCCTDSIRRIVTPSSWPVEHELARLVTTRAVCGNDFQSPRLDAG